MLKGQGIYLLLSPTTLEQTKTAAVSFVRGTGQDHGRGPAVAAAGAAGENDGI